jgi:hypothetical protein
VQSFFGNFDFLILAWISASPEDRGKRVKKDRQSLNLQKLQVMNNAQGSEPALPYPRHLVALGVCVLD